MINLTKVMTLILALGFTGSFAAGSTGRILEITLDAAKALVTKGDATAFQKQADTLFKAVSNAANQSERVTKSEQAIKYISGASIDSAAKARLITDLQRLKTASDESVDGIKDRMARDIDFVRSLKAADDGSQKKTAIAVRSCNHKLEGEFTMTAFSNSAARYADSYYSKIASGKSGELQTELSKLGIPRNEAIALSKSQSGAEVYALLKMASNQDDLGQLAGKVINTAKKANGGKLIDAEGKLVPEAGLARFAFETGDQVAAKRLSQIIDDEAGDMNKVARRLVEGEEEGSQTLKRFKDMNGPCCYNMCKYLN